MNSSSKKLLFICPSFPAIGGVENVTAVLVDFFLSSGFEVSLLVGKKRESGGGLDKHLNLMIEMQGWPNSIENLDFIKEFIENNSIDVVFNQGVFTDIYKLKNLFSRRVILINTLHSIPFWETRKVRYSMLRNIISKISPGLAYSALINHYRLNIENSDYYVVLNMAFKIELEKILYNGIPTDKILVMPNPVVYAVKNKIEKAKSVLYVGRLERIPKRIDKLLKIWSLVEKDNNEWHLDILGDGSERQYLENMCVRYNIRNVTFHGYKETADFYTKSSILVLTSEYEGAPLVITEAQVNRLVPVVFDCSPAIKEMIDDGESGFIIPNGDLIEFSKKLKELMKCEDKLHEMSEKASINAKTNDITTIGNKWIDIINS